jgi:hypothetical protein
MCAPMQALCARINGWFHDATAEPDFKQIVEKSLALFGVFTGATLSFYIGDFLFANKLSTGFATFGFGDRACLVAGVIALLLRYIVGSAVHLNLRYVPKVTTSIVETLVPGPGGQQLRRLDFIETKGPSLKSLRWLFFDIVMLVFFGLLAVFILHASDLREFMWYAAYFVGAGFVWGLVAATWRPDDAAIAKRWMVIDISQLAITLVLILLYSEGWAGDLIIPPILAAVYVFCLLVDFAVVSRPPVDPSAAAVAQPPVAAA